MQIGVGLSLPLLATRRSGGFSPLSLFTGGVQGAWYDPSDYSTLFQDSAGTTPVTAVEQPVGLMLDKSQGLVLGPEIIVNGDFSNGSTGWAPQTNWSIASGKASGAATNANLVTTAGGYTTGKWYLVTFTISDYVGGSVLAWIRGNYTPTAALGNGTFTRYIAAGSGSDLFLFTGSGFTGSIDNVSVKELPGNHASQATAASRPVLRARYNQATYSEQVDNAAWNKANIVTTGSWVNQLTAPDGTLTADLVRPTNISSAHYALLNSTLPNVAGTYTCSLYVYASGYTKFALRESASTGAYVSFDIATVSVIDSANLGAVTILSSSIAAVAGSPGWYRAVVTYVYSSGGITPNLGYWPLPTSYTTGQPASVNWAGDGTSGIYIWGAQIVTGSSAGTYQRIAAATDYATAGFLPYLAGDGVDDQMSSNSINLTGTDKLTAVFGSLSNATTNQGVFQFGAGGAGTMNALYLVGAPSDMRSSLQGSTGTSQMRVTGTGVSTASVYSQLYNIAGATAADESQIRVNGTLPTQTVQSAGPAGGGNFANTTLTIFQYASAFFLNGRIYQLVFCGKTLSASELASTEAYVATKTEVTL